MTKTMLTEVRERLDENKGNLRLVADETGIAYDTVHRIKNGEGDPGYSKVETLYRYFRQTRRKFKPT